MNNGKKFDNLQIDSFVKIIESQQATKELTEGEFYSLLLNTFIDNYNSNKFYKKTPTVFKSLSVFYVQLSLAFKQVYKDLNQDVFEFCHYLYNKTLYCPEIYKTNYGAFEVHASEASRILKAKGIYKI